MTEYFITALKALKNYTGMKLLLALTALAWIYLFFSEKDKVRRIIFVFMPLVVGVIFVCPLTMWVFVKLGLDTEIYYRLLWMIPFGVITIYAIVKLISKNLLTRIIGAVLTIAVIVLTGSYAYANPSFFENENMYGIPHQTKDVVDYLRSIEGDGIITVLPSSDLITTIRQYDAAIQIPYGRDMFNPQIPFYHPVYEAYEVPPYLNVEKLLEQTRPYQTEYIIIYAARLLEDDPEEAGLEFVADVEDHLIYRDPVISKQLDEIAKYYE